MFETECVGLSVPSDIVRLSVIIRAKKALSICDPPGGSRSSICAAITLHMSRTSAGVICSSLFTIFMKKLRGLGQACFNLD